MKNEAGPSISTKRLDPGCGLESEIFLKISNY